MGRSARFDTAFVLAGGGSLGAVEVGNLSVQSSERRRYDSASEHGDRSADTEFILAALCYRVDEVPASRRAIERAVPNGDQSARAAGLRRVTGEARSADAHPDGCREPPCL